MAQLSSLVQRLLALAAIGCAAARSASRYYQMRPGDVMVGGLYSIHDSGTDYSNCTGAIDDNFVILAEAHLLSLQYVNEHVLASINMTLGTRMWDTCNSAAITLQHCVNFIDTAEHMDHGICGPSLNQSDSSSYSGDDSKSVDYDSIGTLAVTGAFSSSVAKNVNYLMQAFCIPVVGTTSTSSEFDDYSRYPYFLRTCASDKFRAQVVFDTLQARDWMHAAVIFDPSDFGFALKKEFQQLVDVCSSIGADLRLFKPPCIERYIELEFDAPGDEESQNRLTTQLEALRQLLNNGGPRVLLLFMEVGSMKRLFDNLEQWGFDGNDFQFVVANGIGFDNETRWNAFMNNTLSIEDSLSELTILKEQLEKVTLNQTNNTWLKELIETQNNCCHLDDELTSDCLLVGKHQCSGDEKLLTVPFVALRQARLIFEAINVIAHSVKAVHHRLCDEKQVGYCSAMKNKITGGLLYDAMLKSSFKEEDGAVFRFFQVGKSNITNSAMPTFDVYQYQTDQWRVVEGGYNPFFGPTTAEASWSTNFSKSEVNQLIRPALWEELARESDGCQKTCVRSYAFLRPGDQCCWTCKECESRFEIVNTTLQECQMCPENTLPDEETLLQCVPMDDAFLFAKPNGVLWILLGLCVVGMVLSGSAGLFIYRHRGTPMVRASTPDLCYLQAGCLVLMFSTTALMLPTSSAFVCGASWALSSSLLAFCHAISTVKALRICRPLFYTRLASHMSHSQSSTAMISAAMLCHFLIIGLWLMLRPPSIHHDRMTDQTGYYDWCSSSDEPQTIILFLMPMGLLSLTALFLRRGLRNMYMFQVRQTRIAFAGALCFFANYIILLSFIFMQDHEDIMLQSIMLMCVPMLTGFVSWSTMLFPVIYVLIFKSKQNKREYITRERSRQFTEGNMMYFVDAVILKKGGKHRARTITTEPNG